jgi:hypothetical protein
MLSTPYTVRSVDEAFSAALAWHLAPFRRASGDHHAVSVELFVDEEDEDTQPQLRSLYRGGLLRYRHDRVERLLGHAVWDLHATVPKGSRDFVFLHAGSVTRDGRALVLPAAMDAGKSSLVVALLERGFGYLSDELGSIDPVTGRAYPFQKRISLDDDALGHFDGLRERLVDRTETGVALPQRYVRPEDLGAGVAEAAPPRWIVFLGMERSGPPRLEAVPRADAVRRMATNCFNLYRYQERGVVLLTRVAQEAEAFELRGGTPRERAALLEERLS